jgi:hypothetical protein
MARQRVEYLDSLTQPLQPAPEAGLPLGVIVATLSHDEHTGAITWLSRIAPQWQQIEAGYFQADLELLIVSGDLSVGETRMERGAYCYWPAGTWHGPMRSAQGCDVLLMFAGLPGFTAAAASTTDARSELCIEGLDTLRMPWEVPPAVAGRSSEAAGTDLHAKIFRTDPQTGAYTLMVRQAPGWSEPKLEAHDCWEELILMEGDYLMGTNGLVQAGTYIFRPERIPHGPQATRTGSVWLGRGNQTIDFQFSQVDWADGMIRDYLAAPLDDGRLNRTPWGVWSQPA